MLVLLPGIFYLTMATDRKVFSDPIKIAWVIFSVAVGILQYAYLFWRYYDPHAIFLHAQVFDFRSFVSFATGSAWKLQMFSSSLLEVIFKKVPKFLNGFFIEFFYLLVPLGIVGMAKLKIKKYNLFMLLCFVCNLIFAINYNIRDISSYFIPSYFVYAIYIGIGSQAIHDRVSPKIKRIFYAFIVFMLICFLGINFHYNKFFTQPEKIQRSEKVKEMLKVMGKDAVFVAPDYGYLEIFHYYLLGEGIEKKSNLYVVFHEFMNDVENYVTHNGKLYLIEQRKYLPEHLAVFCTESDVDQFTQKGFKVEKRYENLFRVSQK
ncbi:MAG: hypothetical protein JXO51_11080 [Candidatus Aminicenantes bacterium]|nr:hypothetical protein [Candidatus Aminicenantes bacterium]